jgi:hypothetical protein
MTKQLRRTPEISNREMVTALKNEAKSARASGDFMMSTDSKAFIVIGKERHRLAITSVPATISRLKNKVLTRTGSN